MPIQQELQRLFTYEPETGKLVCRVARSNRLRVGSEVGYINGLGYRVVGLPSLNGKRVYKTAHRIIWMMQYGTIPNGMEIDHINGRRSDNRLRNLRLVHHLDNQRNVKKRSDNTSGAVGVWKSGRRWQSDIHVNGQKLSLGSFEDKADAIKARKAAEREYGFHPNHGRDGTMAVESSF